MGRLGAWLLLVIFAVTVSSSTGCVGCPKSSCDAPNTTSCDGDQVVTCMAYEGDPCSYNFRSEGIDCGEHGADCGGEGECVLRGERCPAGAGSFCRDGRAHRCVGDRVALPQDCSAMGLTCFDVTLADGKSGGVCALDPTPCKEPSYISSECRDNQRVTCWEGFATSAEPCDVPGERCLERGSLYGVAECALDAPCPAAGGSVCSGSRVYGCDNGQALTRLRDCSASGDVCVTMAGRGLCSASSAGGPGASWLPLPGGTLSVSVHEPGAGIVSVNVTLSDFEMLEREVTVAEYAACVASGVCTAPTTLGPTCERSGRPTRPELHADLPVACVTFGQAVSYCGWAGGRVPTQAEWEYALTSGGADVRFPWGDEAMSCAHAILWEDGAGGIGCGRGEPWRGCSRPSDRSAQGICDLAGNVEEWTINLGLHGGGTSRGAHYRDFARQSLRDAPAWSGDEPSGARGIRCVR